MDNDDQYANRKIQYFTGTKHDDSEKPKKKMEYDRFGNMKIVYPTEEIQKEDTQDDLDELEVKQREGDAKRREKYEEMKAQGHKEPLN